MAKRYLDVDVYHAALERIGKVFSEFPNVLVAFSGGKDSSVCLEIAHDYAAAHGLLGHLSMFHLDYEAQYQMTTDFVDATFKRFPDIGRYWLCLPMDAESVCNHAGGWWTPWDEDQREIWVRKMPDYPYVINERNVPFRFRKHRQDYDLQDDFSKWFASERGKTAVVIGIRADESLHRFHAVETGDRATSYKGINWMSCLTRDVVKAYPIYDWAAEDDFKFFGKFERPYNKLYDLYYEAGLKPHEMRVASPFNSCAGATLRLYKAIDPDTWGKMLSRVNGANFVALYGNTRAMGWKSATKPDDMTWKQYANFLLSTLDTKSRDHYLSKLRKSVEFWRTTGAGLDSKTISELEREGVRLKVMGKVSNRTTKSVVRIPDYLDDTGVSQFALIPTYKRFCICILKNDWNCLYMGFGRTKGQLEREVEAIRRMEEL